MNRARQVIDGRLAPAGAGRWIQQVLLYLSCRYISDPILTLKLTCDVKFDDKVPA